MSKYNDEDLDMKMKACRRCGKLLAGCVDCGPNETCPACGYKMEYIDFCYGDLVHLFDSGDGDAKHEALKDSLAVGPDREYWIHVRKKYDEQFYKPSIKKNKQPKHIYTPKCPICGSPDVKKISMFAKGFLAGIFGIYSLPYQSKQWHCNNCDTDF